MKIAMLTELFHPHIAGCERRFLELGKRLAKRGHEVHVFTIRFKKDLPKEEVVEGIFVHRYAHSENYLKENEFRSLVGVLKYSLATATKIAGGDFDVYYSNQWPLLHSVFAKPFAPCLVQEWCEVWFDRIVMLEKMLKKITRQHVAVSEFTKRRLVNFLDIEPENIDIIPNGVDYHRFSNNGPREKKWGRIVYVGRLVPHKHIEMLISVKQRMPSVELDIVGSGPMLSDLGKKADEVDGVRVYGNLSDDRMIEVLKEAWVCVLPSEREGSGIVALEAMAAGVPVITVDSPHNATKEMIGTMNGTVVPPTVDGLVEGVKDLLTDEGRWYNVSRNASAFAKQYDWDIIATKMENYLGRVIKG